MVDTHKDVKKKLSKQAEREVRDLRAGHETTKPPGVAAALASAATRSPVKETLAKASSEVFSLATPQPGASKRAAESSGETPEAKQSRELPDVPVFHEPEPTIVTDTNMVEEPDSAFSEEVEKER